MDKLITASAELDAVMRDYYERRAGEYDEWYLRLGSFADRPEAEQWRAELEILRERVSAFANGKLLEIAPGTGWWTRHLAPGAQVTVVDYAPAMLAQVAARLRDVGLEARRIRGDAYALPLGRARFDSCFMGFFLSHVPFARLHEFFGGVRRVMKPGGLVMVVDSAALGESNRSEPGQEQIRERILNDGSRHRVLKIDHSPETIGATLAPLGQVLEAWVTGKFFVGAVVRVASTR
jgi:ubiquinone/menaquinone biosynthesis C-methylase UbiE